MYFNPRGYVSLDGSWVPNIASGNNFNPRGYVSLDSTYDNIGTILAVFQSTRLRKPRRGNFLYCVSIIKFQSTRLRKPRPKNLQKLFVLLNFNPRGYVSLDATPYLDNSVHGEFQSTRLRKPRQQKHSKKHKDLDYKYNFYTNISTYLYMINPQNIYVHNI